jgi:hypothetical protein
MDDTVSPTLPSSLPTAVICPSTRATRSREAALLRLRASTNRRAAQRKLWMKKQSTPVATSTPAPGVSNTTTISAQVVVDDTVSPTSTLFVSSLPQPSAAISNDTKVALPLVTELDCKMNTTVDLTRWSVSAAAGLILRNSRNNCWFHSALHLLTGVPSIRSFCSSLPRNLGTFENHLFKALYAIFTKRNAFTVASLFPLVKDCDGVQHRYGQIAVPDFIDYLCRRSTWLSKLITFTLTTRLQCSQCQWARYPSSTEVTLKLYFPEDRKLSTLEDLVDFNSRAALGADNTVNCSNCGIKTSHTYLRTCNPDVFLIEISRVTNTLRGLKKNTDPINFATELQLPGFTRRYRVLASAHHLGTLRGGHWVTRVCTLRGWFEMDDLRKKHLTTAPPGINDNSAAVVLLVASDRLS